MVGLTVATVVVVATAGAAGPAVLAGVQAGAGIGTTVGLGSAATGAAVTGAAAVGGTAGAIGGSVAAGTGAAAFAGAAGGAAAGAGSAGAVSSIAAGVATGPVGWILLGAAEEPPTSTYTFDCWKPVLHDDSPEPSNGKLLKDIFIDSRIKQVLITIDESHTDLPHLVLENIWGECFRIDYLYLPSNLLAAHAIRL